MTLRDLKIKCEQARELYIYGSGGFGRIIMAYLMECNIYVNGFVETKKTFEEVMGKTVKNIDEIHGENIFFIVGVGKKYSVEIVHLLEHLGFINFFVAPESLIIEMQSHSSYNKTFPINKNYINVLLYHRVVNTDDPWNISVSVEHFEEHIRYLKNNYPVLRFEDDWNCVNEKSVCITFDDGYVDNYHYALPILDKYEVPATFFVSTGNIGTEREFWWDRLSYIMMNLKEQPNCIVIETDTVRLTNDGRRNIVLLHKYLNELSCEKREKVLNEMHKMLNMPVHTRNENRSLSENEIKAMSNFSLVTIGAHTVTHSCLAKESVDVQAWEIKQSKMELERIIGRPIDVFSYPFGGRTDFDLETLELVKKSGYKKAAANWRGTVNCETNKFCIPRNKVWDSDIKSFLKQLRGTWYMFGDD